MNANGSFTWFWGISDVGDAGKLVKYKPNRKKIEWSMLYIVIQSTQDNYMIVYYIIGSFVTTQGAGYAP